MGKKWYNHIAIFYDVTTIINKFLIIRIINNNIPLIIYDNVK